MKTPAIVCAIVLLSIPATAQAGERHKRHADARHHKVERQVVVKREPQRERYVKWRLPFVLDDSEDGYAPDTPWGPKYTSQEEVSQSRYDFVAGKKANIKEYWWRY